MPNISRQELHLNAIMGSNDPDVNGGTGSETPGSWMGGGAPARTLYI